MKETRCANCGANDFVYRNGYMVCDYCGSKYATDSSVCPQESIGVSLSSDINNLIRKCQSDPRNARKYANLILDIDPTNPEARKYL